MLRRSPERRTGTERRARRKLPKILPCGVTILMKKDSPPIRENGDYHHRAMVNHKFARGGKPAGLGNTLTPDIEDAAAKYGLAFENARPFLRLRLGGHF